MSIVENTNDDEANVAQDVWAWVVTCDYDSSCMVVSKVNSDWFFGSFYFVLRAGSCASKHTVPCKRVF